MSDIQTYHYAKEGIEVYESLGFSVTVSTSGFMVKNQKGMIEGQFPTAEAIYYSALGYRSGFEDGCSFKGKG